MPAILDSLLQSPSFQYSAPYGAPPTAGMPGPATAGLAVFGDVGLGSLNDPSKPLTPFGVAPLRHASPYAAHENVAHPASGQGAQMCGMPQMHVPQTQPQAQSSIPTWQASGVVNQDPAFRASGPMLSPVQPYPQPGSVNPPTTSMGGVSATALMSALEQRQQGAETDVSSLETLRMQMFGRYHEEVEARMKELRAATDGNITRSRRALMERMDELGAGLHRDMVAMRQEMQKELEDLKRDVFSAVMSISALNDKLGLTDSRFRETWMAVTKALTDRIDNQAVGLASSIKGMDARIDQLVEERVDGLVEQAMLRQVAAWRAKQTAAAAA